MSSQTQSKTSMLTLKNVGKTFGAGTVNEKAALTEVSLNLDAGDFVTVIGSNGAGKSTLFSVVSGAVQNEKGMIFLDGDNITFKQEHKRSRDIGRIFQDPLKGTAPGMTIEENLALAYIRSGKGKGGMFSRTSKADRALFKEKLSALGIGLENRLNHPVGLLSGGQRQALTLLMATLVTPKLLLLDEHTAALDPSTAEKVLALTENVVAENQLTCMMITHNISNALELGNRTIMMDNGRIVFDVKGEERAKMTVKDVIETFRENAAKNLDNDRMLLS